MKLTGKQKAQIKKMVKRVIANMKPYDIDELDRVYEESKRFYS